MRVDRRRILSIARPLAALVALALPAAAQADFVNNTTDIPTGAPANNSFTENVDFADVDADGDFDAIWADGGDAGNDQSRIWINQGGLQGKTIGVFADATAARFPVVLADSRDVDFVDIDNDGDDDIYVSDTSTSANQSNRWWINQGGLQGGTLGFFQDQTSTRWVNIAVNNGSTFSSIAASLALPGGGFVDWSCDCSFADLDNDGDMDLVHTTYGGNLIGLVPSRMFLNRGGAQGQTIGFYEEFNPSHFQLSGSDIANGSPGLWCEGTHQHGNTNTTGTQCDIADTPLGVELGDLDGDLDIDVIQGARNEVPRYYLNRLQETGSLAFRDVSHARFPANWAPGGGHYEQELGDMDNDNDLDIYGLNWDNVCDRFFKNNGSGTYAAPVAIANSCSDDNEPDWFDYDNDGNLDAFVANFGAGDRLYHNTGAGGGFGLTEVTATELPAADFNSSLGSDCCDVDDDGDYDVFVANDSGGANQYYKNVNQIADTRVARVANLEQAPNRSPSATPTVIRVHVYDNSSWNIAQFNVTTLEYQVNGGGFTSVPMRYVGGQVFRGEIPGNLSGTIDYRANSTDEHANTGTSSTKNYTSICTGSISTYCTAKLNSSGCTPMMTSSGAPSASAGSGFSINGEQVLAAKAGLLFYGINGPGGAAFQGGHLCATAPTKRTALQTATSAGSPPCMGVFSYDFNVRIASGADPALVSGQSVWTQYWTRDAGVPSGTGLTNGLTFTICD